MCMVQGLDPSFAGAVFVGYHSCAGTEGGVLNHTLLGKEIQNVYLNGEPTGETRLNAAYAGHFGIPVLLVAGDAAVCEEAQRVLGDVQTVAVKDGIDKFTADCLHPQVAQDQIREATARARCATGTGSARTGSARPMSSGSSGTRRRSRPPAPSSPGSG